MTRLRQRILTWTLTCAVAVSAMPMNVMAADYEMHWAKDAIERWTNNNVVKGYEDGTFRPNQQVTRAELAAFLVRVFGYSETGNAVNYTDVDGAKWYAHSIAIVSSAELMHIEGNTFKPNAPATREEAMYALAQAYSLSKSSDKTFSDRSEERRVGKEC